MNSEPSHKNKTVGINKLNGVRSFLKMLQLLRWSRIPALYDKQRIISEFRKASPLPYLESHKSSPYPLIHFLYDPF